MAILTNSGRAALAAAIKDSTLHLAWGSGDASWDSAPQSASIEDTALVNEVGRRSATQVTFCSPDSAGDIILPDGRYTTSTDPTKHLYCRFSYDFDDASEALIREAAIFVGTGVDPGLPVGQVYFTPDEIIDGGILLLIERFPVIDRSASERRAFEYVLTL